MLALAARRAGSAAASLTGRVLASREGISPRRPTILLRCARASASESRGEKSECLVVMGIETSCDDTGVAVMRGDGQLLGSCLRSQTQVHKTTGGIVPIVAADLHRDSLQSVTDTALRESGLQLEDVDMVAVTVGPGLALCLQAGLEFVRPLAGSYRLKTSAHTLITRIAMEENWRGNETPLPGFEDICASFQEALTRHLLTRTHRALLYTRQHFPDIGHFVLSGGVASNEYLRGKLRLLLHHYDIALHCPPPHLCTDNGVMIAWAAIENMRSGQKPTSDLESLDFRPRWPLGEDISSHVEKTLAHTKLPKIPNL